MSEKFPYMARRLMPTVLTALKELGGSGSLKEIHDKVIELENIGDVYLDKMHKDTGNTEIFYQIRWACSYLKLRLEGSLLDNPNRGVWVLTEVGRSIQPENIDANAIVSGYLARHKKLKEERNKKAESQTESNMAEDDDFDDMDIDEKWRIDLHRILTKEMSPDGFERLVQRILRLSGFEKVEVTGRSGDGGIDGKGIATINDLISFHIMFQCKKYKGSVTSSDMRDFRGALQGRADRGLFITTGTFTRGAIEEATRDGASPIDTIDGEELADKLKALNLGVKTEMVEKITILSDELLKI